MLKSYFKQIKREGKSLSTEFLIDAVDKKTSNWLRYVNCPMSEREANLASFQYYGNIYYRTFKPIKK